MEKKICIFGLSLGENEQKDGHLMGRLGEVSQDGQFAYLYDASIEIEESGEPEENSTFV